MAEQVDERGRNEQSQIVVGKSPAAFLPALRVWRPITPTSGLTLPGSGYLSNASAITRRFITSLPDSAFFFLFAASLADSAALPIGRVALTCSNLLQGVQVSCVDRFFRALPFHAHPIINTPPFLQSVSA